MLGGVTDRTRKSRRGPAVFAMALVMSLVALAAACGPSAPPSREASSVAPQAVAVAASASASASAAVPAPAEQPVCGAACAGQPLATTLAEGKTETFGEPFATDPAADVDIAQLLADPERFGDQPLTVRGEVTAVCQRRGCWLEIAPAAVGEGEREGEREGCRVISERHDWLVPHDAAGTTARVRGRVQVRTISAEQVAHMESEGGRFANKQPDGSARELRLISTGVALAR